MDVEAKTHSHRTVCLVCQCFIDLHPFPVRSHDQVEQTTVCAALKSEGALFEQSVKRVILVWGNDCMSLLHCIVLRMTSTPKLCGLCLCNSRPVEFYQSGYWSRSFGWALLHVEPLPL